jgi:phosphohistidine phosphatase SixA
LLVPGFGLDQLQRLVVTHTDVAELLLVGHEPDFSRAIAAMTGGRVLMRKGAVACLEVNPSRLEGATLAWLVIPDLLVARASL